MKGFKISRTEIEYLILTLALKTREISSSMTPKDAEVPNFVKHFLHMIYNTKELWNQIRCRLQNQSWINEIEEDVMSINVKKNANEVKRNMLQDNCLTSYDIRLSVGNYKRIYT